MTSTTKAPSDAPGTPPRSPEAVIAVVDASPVLALPALLSLPGPFRFLTLVAAGERDLRAERLASLLGRLLPLLGSGARVDSVPVAALGRAIERASADGPLLLDVSGASPGAAIEAWRRASSLGSASPVHLSCYDPRRNQHQVSAVSTAHPHPPRRLSSGKPVDIGVGGRVRPGDFLALFDLGDLPENPYPALPHPEPFVALRPAARHVLGAYLDPGDGERLESFRRALGAARQSPHPGSLSLPFDRLPRGVARACQALGATGIVRIDDGQAVLLGPPDRNALFFFGGGWLEIAAHEALSLALPDREVQVNAGIRWRPESPGPEAEVDILFVHGGSLCVVSCKNDWNDERVFSHLRELRALVAEMGEAFVRPTLVSTRALSEREESRALSYEIGAFSGPPLLAALHDGLAGDARRFLDALRERGHGAPAPGRKAAR